jgi:hypothetical protein
MHLLENWLKDKIFPQRLEYLNAITRRMDELEWDKLRVHICIVGKMNYMAAKDLDHTVERQILEHAHWMVKTLPEKEGIELMEVQEYVLQKPLPYPVPGWAKVYLVGRSKQ